ncbi:hypothetical protein BDP81DRAFT_322140 [Colletotrichum phormii]|uniref:Zn(2)-C6 fungal-type domain-containing protein n=1 Tax=Colletotrichum phormii TaxID=359342 RepID=A0AAI9ZRP7_9PEZI|nr:uncharacterized protein BDP81DRAFT_322140 [Colletotrichum phormii]KAK1635579.1 hypothetical protein BDP81DRAFT_322140 [Colletotrichum phormii]
MVGVGGRSKACDHCRRRRVKCDLAAPECARCVKAHLKCGGCRGLSFIQYNGHRTTHDATDVSDMHEIIPIQIAQPYVTPWSMDDVYASYAMDHLLHESEEVVVKSGTNRTLTNQCFIALSTTIFGIDQKEPQVLQHGLHRYGTALKALNRALSDPKESRSFDVLEAIIVMAVFEMIAGNREDGWIEHARGLERLLDFRGPKSMQPLPCLVLLEKARPSMIFAALVTRKSTILSRALWKGLPWMQNPERKNPLQLLLDVVADCPELFVLRENIFGKTEGLPCKSSLLSLLEMAQRVLNDLETWEKSWSSTELDQYDLVSAPAATTPVRSGYEGSCGPVWNTVFMFHSLYNASISTLFHGTLILLLLLIHSLRLALRDSIDHGIEPEPIPVRIHESGIHICRSVDFHLDKLRDIATSSVLFPIRMAYEAVGKSDEVVGLWLMFQLKHISAGSTGRWAMARHVLCLNPVSNITSNRLIRDYSK